MARKSISYKEYTILFLLVIFTTSCKKDNKRKLVYPSSTVTYGEAFFLNNCARCHGDRGQGDIEKEIPRLRNEAYSFSEIKNTLLSPAGIMPKFDIPDSIVHQIVTYLNKN